ncbi:MAG TPA: hypothetical protein VKA89_09705 [Solirubrobacterales bacterium]|nr:hypothetical protein [Solirubrobacterales bacterium]
MNFAKVRSAIQRATIALAAALAAAAIAPPRARADGALTIAILPPGTTVEQLGEIDGIAPGLMSAGLGRVPPEQTYLDITQGNRVFDSLYGSELPRFGHAEGLGVTHLTGWDDVLARARSAPADIVPGLLGSQVRLVAADLAGAAQLLAADTGGKVFLAERDCPGACERGPRVIAVGDRDELAERTAALRGNDLLIAFERPPPEPRGALALGIAGRGFDGTLTSDSTRLDGYVLTTDLAPTILERFGEPVPSAMSGEPIRAGGDPDPAAVAELGDRLSEIGARRGPVIRASILAWLVALAIAVAASRGRLAAPGLRLLALAVIYMPLALLAGALLQPSTGVERLIVLLGAPALGAATLALLSDWRALAAACGLTSLAYAADLVAGSPLTSLSLMGPNPGLGVRFFDIGNELEATLAPLVIVGTGAALTAWRPRDDPARAAGVFLATGFFAALVFAAGRFGADVGAAIVFPVGAAVAAAVLVPRRFGLLAIVAIPVGALALLAVIDLVGGGGAHLTSSVLDAGGLGDLADVAERRLRLSAHSFERAIGSVFLPLVIVVLAIAVWQRERLLALWEKPPLRASLLGAAAATVVGTLANDSGALLLEIGTAYLLVMTGFAWAEARR